MTPEFIYDTMREKDFRFFEVYTPNMQTVYSSLEHIPIEDSISRLEKFIINASSGMYRIRITDDNKLRANKQLFYPGFLYEVMIDRSVSREKNDNSPIGNISSGNEQMFDRFVGAISSNSELASQVSGMQKELEFDRKLREIEKKYEAEIRELKSNSGFSGIIGEIAKELGPQALLALHKKPIPAAAQKPIAGINASLQAPKGEIKPVEVKKETHEALEYLFKHDPDFGLRLIALSNMRANNPDMYKMACEMLNKL